MDVVEMDGGRRRRRYVPSIEATELLRIDGRLATLGRGVGAMRLRIGEGLLRLEASGGVHALGFPTLESYAREALGRSGRWGSDVRGLARRLAGLPALRAALASGRLSSSMVELVARVATPEDEVAWVERAATMHVRAMRAELKAARVEVVDDLPRPRSTLRATVDRVDAWAFERARLMLEAVGASKGDGVIEAMLAEGLTEILARHPDTDLPHALTAEAEDDERAWRAEMAAIRETAEAAVDALKPVAAASYEPEAEIDWPEEVTAIDARLRDVASKLARRDLELGELARRADFHEIWRILGYRSLDHYARERIGLSPSSVSARVALAKRVAALPELREAITAGAIGYASAALVARVAGPATADAWIARAKVRTVKLLREEVEAVELVARAEGEAVTQMAPPDDEVLEGVRAIERSVIEVVTGGGGQMSGTMGDDGADGPSGQMSGGGVEVGMTTIQMSVGEDVARFWRALERLHGGLEEAADESFVAFLVRAVMRPWAGVSSGGIEYEDVYVRDRWRCQSPVCTSRNVTPHHVVFRSRGGGEERENLVSLCEKCHLELVHGGRMRVGGVAPGGLSWGAVGWGYGVGGVDAGCGR